MGIIRMSIALAKFRLDDTVCEWDVLEALRLLESSREAIDGKTKQVVNKSRQIAERIMSLLDSNDGEFEEVSLKMTVANALHVAEVDITSEISKLVNRNLIERLNGNLIKL